jgi:hypothetical protein
MPEKKRCIGPYQKSLSLNILKMMKEINAPLKLNITHPQIIPVAFKIDIKRKILFLV